MGSASQSHSVPSPKVTLHAIWQSRATTSVSLTIRMLIYSLSICLFNSSKLIMADYSSLNLPIAFVWRNSSLSWWAFPLAFPTNHWMKKYIFDTAVQSSMLTIQSHSQIKVYRFSHLFSLLIKFFCYRSIFNIFSAIYKKRKTDFYILLGTTHLVLWPST